tara:strand:- start:12806 stop:14071 length:1266 start_codon:yes stop_codon:yes gene_type:complete
MASLDSMSAISDVLAVHETTYLGGAYIVATKSSLLRVDSGGNVSRLSDIKTSGVTVRMSENQQNEVIIVTGSNAYVYKQKETSEPFVQLGTAQGFDLNNPVDVVVINTFAIIIGGQDKKWALSSPNNAVAYSTNDIFLTDESMGELTGCAELDNNLFIFGKNGIQRWVPGISRTPEDFPFEQDSNFRKKYGAVSTGSIVSETDRVYFMSSASQVMSLSIQGLEEITTAGISNQLASYVNPQFSRGSIYNYRGSYFYHLTFPEDNASWVFCESSKTWSESDILILDSAAKIALNLNVVILSDGIYQLTKSHSSRLLEINTDVILGPDSTQSYRDALNAVKLDLVQGLPQAVEPQYIELALSTDNLYFGNRVNQSIGLTGKRLTTTRWRMNVLGEQFTLNFRYYGSLDLTIRRLTVDINQERT